MLMNTVMDTVISRPHRTVPSILACLAYSSVFCKIPSDVSSVVVSAKPPCAAQVGLKLALYSKFGLLFL